GLDWVHPSGDSDSVKKYWDNTIEVFYRLGYDYIRISGGIYFPGKSRVTDDTAALSRGKRSWSEEGTGVITSWEDFEKYPWPSLDEVDLRHYEYASGKVPEGMGVFVCPTSGFFEVAKEPILGYENLSYLLYDDPALVKAVIDRVGEIIYGFYEKLIGLPNLAGFFQGDDMGYKNSTLVSPAVLREYILPWHKKLAKLAHDNELIYMLHCCGNIENIMEDLINDVKIDTRHSFEDEAMPVIEAKKKYGNRIGILGGVDMDRLCRLPEDELRKYVRNILEKCMPGGRYALGSGNTVANYVPVKNYLVMLEEGINFG
ncbi:MAG: uroporphyrinogen-III decarboxylase-like protein, partial [Clostridiaceae bacterium]|nr:uroporphyrinogen-III decarboxylase-like protein [Clostridiaceae bacterium]